MSTERRQPLFMNAMAATRGRRLTPADKLVLAYFACRQGRNGESWPGLKTICRDLDLAVQTVLDSIKRLCAAGLLQKTPGSRGRGHSSRYTVCLAKTSTPQSFTDDTKPPESRDFETEKRSTPQSQKVYSSEMNLSRIDHKSKKSALTRPSSRTTAGRKKPKAKTARRAAFIPPTVDEVSAYADSRGVPDFDAAKFIGYYEPRGWIKVNGQPVLDWKGTIRTWIDRDNQRRIDRGEPPLDGYSQYGTHPATEEEIEALERAGVL